YGIPNSPASHTSGDKVMPTTAAPPQPYMAISAAVSSRGPSVQTYTPCVAWGRFNATQASISRSRNTGEKGEFIPTPSPSPLRWGGESGAGNFGTEDTVGAVNDFRIVSTTA